MTVAQLAGDPTCCLPCPATDWTYPDSFITYNKISAWLNVAGFALISFLLISYLVLPAQKTRSHYLSISLIVAVMFINLGFIVPLIDKPDQCYDIITPNDLYSSMTCAWSGAFIVAGGLCGATWSKCNRVSFDGWVQLTSTSLHPCLFNASPDMLGYRARPKVLLHIASVRLGRASSASSSNHDRHWRILPCRRCMPR